MRRVEKFYLLFTLVRLPLLLCRYRDLYLLSAVAHRTYLYDFRPSNNEWLDLPTSLGTYSVSVPLTSMTDSLIFTVS